MHDLDDDVDAHVAILTGPPVVGFATLYDGTEPLGIGRVSVEGEWCGVTSVDVSPAARRRGIGSAVMTVLLAWAQQQRCDLVVPPGAGRQCRGAAAVRRARLRDAPPLRLPRPARGSNGLTSRISLLPHGRRADRSGRGAAADNPRVATAEPEALTPAGRRWVERAQRPLDLLAVVFLVNMILIWSFPDGSPAFLHTLDVVAWIVWACFAVDYVARLLLSVSKARFIRTHKLDLLMALLPMLRLLRIFLLLRRSLASVSTEKIAGSILSIVIAVVFASAFFMWRVEYDAPGRDHHHLARRDVVGRRDHDDGGLRRLHPGHPGGPRDRDGRHDRGHRPDRNGERHRGGLVRHAAERARHRAVDGTSADVEPRRARPPTRTRRCCSRLDELAAQQDEIRALLIALQRPTTSG